jgi:predicted RNA-binding Zn-ribbon protein involved in translation (DUF1610 family)
MTPAHAKFRARRFRPNRNATRAAPIVRLTVEPVEVSVITTDPPGVLGTANVTDAVVDVATAAPDRSTPGAVNSDGAGPVVQAADGLESASVTAAPGPAEVGEAENPAELRRRPGPPRRAEPRRGMGMAGMDRASAGAGRYDGGGDQESGQPEARTMRIECDYRFTSYGELELSFDCPDCGQEVIFTNPGSCEGCRCRAWRLDVIATSVDRREKEEDDTDEGE